MVCGFYQWMTMGSSGYGEFNDMQLWIDGEVREFVPVQQFREEQGLSHHFGITLFYQKDFTGKGNVQGAGAVLNELRKEIIASIPNGSPTQGWLTFSLELQLLFHRKLREINPQVGLQQSEIEYAVAGFGEVTQMYIQSMLRARMTGKEAPTFDHLYERWQYQSALTSNYYLPYHHNAETWRVYLVKYIYGLVGFKVETERDTYYVQDTALACPAEGFMTAMLRDVTEKIDQAMRPK
jgi:hypothetical protein